jgi:hypothetical protein
MEPKRNPRGEQGGGGAIGAAGGSRLPGGAIRPGVAGPAGQRGAAAGGAAARTGQAGPAPAPGIGDAVDQLTADVKQLRVDFERFFSGALPLPPEELRNRVQLQLRTLRNVNAGSAVDRFRLGDLEARFNSYNELFNRRMRQREEGHRQAAHAATLGETPRQRFDPAAGVVIGAAADPAAVSALYEGLAAGGEGPRFDLASFDAYLQRQAAAIRAKSGCTDVLFRLAAEDGKLKLKARPVGGAKTVQP